MSAFLAKTYPHKDDLSSKIVAINAKICQNLSTRGQFFLK